jgi:hypothetical protein
MTWPGDDLTWQEFENDLADRFRRMPGGHFLVLSHRGHQELYVQFRVDEDGPLLGECRGLGGSVEPEGQQSRLEQLGWHSPDPKAGLPNYWRYWPANRPPKNSASSGASEDDLRAAASQATRTMRDVLGIPSPSHIEEQSGS